MTTIHPTAAQGFDPHASEYEKARLAYPQAAVDRFASSLGIKPEMTVLDLAAGTGKLTRELLRTGARLNAVEPLAGMRKVFSEILPAISVLEGTAEAIPLADFSVDIVVVAQAFH